MTFLPFLPSSLRRSAFLSLAGLAFSASSLLFGQSVTYTGASSALNFGSVNVCPAGQATPTPCSNTITLTYDVGANTTIGGVGIYTTGATDLDFQAEANDTSATLCSAKTYMSATTCTVDVTFAPLGPGQRKGAIQIVDGSGNVLATTLIYGAGLAPEIAFSPSPQVKLASGYTFNSPAGVAVDASGNVFVADAGLNKIRKILAVNGVIPANPTVVTLASDSKAPKGVAVDGAGTSSSPIISTTR